MVLIFEINSNDLKEFIGLIENEKGINASIGGDYPNIDQGVLNYNDYVDVILTISGSVASLSPIIITWIRSRKKVIKLIKEKNGKIIIHSENLNENQILNVINKIKK